ncbi:glycosyltransferase family 39 protein [Tundrisphaera sp. TA3]|uniref:glycosyltransferase family 39 protein n=1 Tax=Tundrisphaera sp. TA3 TaxID=3435775 RepID=UPI003EB6B6A9
MANRRWLYAVAAMSAALHLAGMARNPLPAQDGLKFLRVARQFQSAPWVDVIRGTDQHPLYPALIAVAEPAVSAVIGPGPDAWRIAAQGVSLIAAIGLLWPLHSLARSLFGDATANLAVFLYALLPKPAELGHDTLADALALAFLVTALCLGERTLMAGSWRSALGCGLALGLGFLTRPEVLLAAPAIVVAGMARRMDWAGRKAMAARLASMAAVAGLLVGGYAFTKGALSEKLSFRIGTRIGVDAYQARKAPLRLPPGLDDARWDFSPKEETGDDALKSRPIDAFGVLIRDWIEGLSWILAPFAIWGVIRSRSIPESASGRRLALAYVAIFAAILLRHATTLGYASGRHALALVAVAVPWAAFGIMAWAAGFSARRGMSLERGGRLGRAALAGLACVAIAVQLKAGHPSRWGHQAAGRWLASAAGPDEAVLDTRGWASFVRGGPSYDYWHVRQALGDAKLAYVVVGADEMEAPSRRAETLRAVLGYAGRQVAGFPGREGGRADDVRVFRFERPESWEGLRR